MSAQPLPEWAKAILREKYPRPDPWAKALREATEAVRAFGEALGMTAARKGPS